MFGSTEDENAKLEEAIEKRLTGAERATVQGLYTEVDILKQRIEHAYEKIDRVHGVLNDLMTRITVLERARVTDLNVRINGGPTDHGADN